MTIFLAYESSIMASNSTDREPPISREQLVSLSATPFFTSQRVTSDRATNGVCQQGFLSPNLSDFWTLFATIDSKGGLIRSLKSQWYYKCPIIYNFKEVQRIVYSSKVLQSHQEDFTSIKSFFHQISTIVFKEGSFRIRPIKVKVHITSNDYLLHSYNTPLPSK